MLPSSTLLRGFQVKSTGGSREKRATAWSSRDAAREPGGEKSHAIEIYL